MTSALVPKALLDGVIRRLDPVEVYLFGSHARGDTHADSDYDLYVVVDDEGAEEKQTGRAVSEARRDYRQPVDILVASRSAFDRRKHMIGALEDVIREEGLKVYARGG